MKSALLAALLFCAWAVPAFLLRCHNVEDVLIDGKIYFVDADCYSRMTRARAVAERFGTVLRRHSFENHPEGVKPHTTVPVDYLIVGLKGALELILPLSGRRVTAALHDKTLDLAGALLSPLLGAVTAGFLALFARGLAREWRAGGWAVPWVAWSAPLWWTLSPILVHGTLLGRPDHQSLLLALLAAALVAEAKLAARPTRRWGIVSGVGWALSLWVSLYEPAILFGSVMALWLALKWRGLVARERWAGWIAFAAILLVALVIEGWRMELPAPEMRPFLASWAQSIGELGRLDPRKPILYRWLGLGCVIAPLLLALAFLKDRRALAAGALLLLVFGLTCWQLRWGYFLGLVFAMTLPWQLAVLRRWWVVWPVAVISLWPTFREWDEQLFPTQEAKRQFAVRRHELHLLRETAEHLRSEESAPFLAPWWISPPLAYWSGQPGVAGSSHQSIAGTVDTARFYLAATSAEAGRILKARGVAQVVADSQASRLVDTSAGILDEAPPDLPLAERLSSPSSDEPARRPPAFLVPTFANEFFRIFAVDQAKLESGSR